MASWRFNQNFSSAVILDPDHTSRSFAMVPKDKEKQIINKEKILGF